MPGLPIYHLLLPMPSKSMQAVMHDWKAIRIHWPSTAVHRNPTLYAAIIVSSGQRQKILRSMNNNHQPAVTNQAAMQITYVIAHGTV